MRRITANGIELSATAGRIRWRRASQAASHSRVSSPSRTYRPVMWVALMPTLWRPDGGRMPNWIANTYFSANARKNTGTAMPTSEKSTDPVSRKVPRRRAAR